MADHLDQRIEQMRERLRSTKRVSRRRNSVAADVVDLYAEIDARRAAGLTWSAIAQALYNDEAKVAAIRSAYGRVAKKSREPAISGARANRNKRPAQSRSRAPAASVHEPAVANLLPPAARSMPANLFSDLDDPFEGQFGNNSGKR